MLELFVWIEVDADNDVFNTVGNEFRSYEGSVFSGKGFIEARTEVFIDNEHVPTGMDFLLVWVRFRRLGVEDFEETGKRGVQSWISKHGSLLDRENMDFLVCFDIAN